MNNFSSAEIIDPIVVVSKRGSIINILITNNEALHKLLLDWLLL